MVETYNFGEIKKVSLREVWPHEAQDFTPWLAENIKSLGNTLGFNLELSKSEARFKGLSLDLLAKDLISQENVIIENQLNETDHDHLGKLITYASGFNASTVIWIAESIRDGHRQALDWLNQLTDTKTRFFGVVVEVLKIDDSRPAVIFKPIITPDKWQKSKAPVSSESEKFYRHYFPLLIDELREKHKFTNANKPQPRNWHEFPSDFSGITYTASFDNKIPRVGVSIEHSDEKMNESLFDALERHKNTIQDSFEESLEWQWQRRDEKNKCAIRFKRDVGPEPLGMFEQKIDELKQWHIYNVLRIKDVFDPLIRKKLNILTSKSG